MCMASLRDVSIHNKTLIELTTSIANMLAHSVGAFCAMIHGQYFEAWGAIVYSKCVDSLVCPKQSWRYGCEEKNQHRYTQVDQQD